MLGNATNLRASYCTESHQFCRRQRSCSLDVHLESMRVQHGCRSSSILVQMLISPEYPNTLGHSDVTKLAFQPMRMRI